MGEAPTKTLHWKTVASWWNVEFGCQLSFLKVCSFGRFYFLTYVLGCIWKRLKASIPTPPLYCQRGTNKACYLKAAQSKKNARASQSHDCLHGRVSSLQTTGNLSLSWIFSVPTITTPLKRTADSCAQRKQITHTASYVPT